MTSQPTVRVRIAVAVDEHGEYYASDCEPNAIETFQWLRGNRHVVWVEADVPLPLPPQTVEGTVVTSEGQGAE